MNDFFTFDHFDTEDYADDPFKLSRCYFYITLNRDIQGQITSFRSGPYDNMEEGDFIVLRAGSKLECLMVSLFFDPKTGSCNQTLLKGVTEDCCTDFEVIDCNYTEPKSAE